MQGINIIAYSTLAVSNTAVGAPSLPSKAKRMFITSETDAIRWRADGTNPSATEGHILAKDDSISFTGANYRQLLEAIKFIRVTTDATLKVTYFD